MKCLSFCTLFCCLITSSLFGQTLKQIEADLSKSFKKISYWEGRQYDTAIDIDLRIRSLQNANEAFAKKLQYYAERFPSTLTYPFNALKKQYLDISTSTDSLFRIYSWDTSTGGTMHWFENVMQYKSESNSKAIIDTPKSEEDVRPAYRKVYTFKSGVKTYYLANYLYIETSRYSAFGITAFTIENGKVVEAKIIKTRSGMHNDLSYESDFNAVSERDRNNLPEIHFDNTTNTISMPLVNSKGAFTKKFILYKFTGQYFERVKN